MPAESPTPSFLPGFDFLKGLASQAGKGFQGLQGLQSLGQLQQWVTPVLDPEELDKRIEELRTVHFWLEQNARLLATTIQALEVQKMTITTLRSMNVPMPDLKAALSGFGGRASEPGTQAKAPARPAPKKTAAAAPPAASPDPVDPMAWWNSLTEQFTQIASKALEQAPSGMRAAAEAAGAAASGSKSAAKSHSARSEAAGDSGRTGSDSDSGNRSGATAGSTSGTRARARTPSGASPRAPSRSRSGKA